MKYVLMFVGSTEDQDSFDRLPPERRAAAYEGANKWFEEQSRAGRLVGGDGPYIEAKEIIGGFAIVEVKDLDEALAMAKAWPAGAVEVRPVVDHSAEIEQSQARHADGAKNG